MNRRNFLATTAVLLFGRVGSRTVHESPPKCSKGFAPRKPDLRFQSEYRLVEEFYIDLGRAERAEVLVLPHKIKGAFV